MVVMGESEAEKIGIGRCCAWTLRLIGIKFYILEVHQGR